jgi:hypothetical protein
METMEKIVEIEAPEIVEPGPVLKMTDRCDRCGHQAYVLAKGIEGELMFCGHHYHDYEYGLIPWAFEIVDERDKIPA